ncbi:MAG: DUF934 domain-containing protein [Parvularculaceae bacterium]|nr:DUF934 domain-containing protein [Parvularculaceae bacterium]
MATLRITDEGSVVDSQPKGEEISLAQWREGARPEAGRFSLSIPNTEDIDGLAEIVARFDGVILEFPHFTDGRAYSQARTLRERLRFKGEVKARGAVLCDQALFMARAGFDALEIGDGDPAGFIRALAAYSVFYQPAADATAPARVLRGAKREAA